VKLEIYTGMSCYAFDIDGVLVVARRRFEEAKRRSRGNRELFWRIFLDPAMLSLDEPRETGIGLLRDRVGRGRVVIVSGRPERLRKATENQLSSFGVPIAKIHAVLLRRNGDKRPEWVVKPELLKDYLTEQRLVLVEAHDDTPRVLEAYAKLYPRARLYLHRDTSHYREYRVGRIEDYF